MEREREREKKRKKKKKSQTKIPFPLKDLSINKNTKRGEFRNSDPFDRVPSAS